VDTQNKDRESGPFSLEVAMSLVGQTPWMSQTPTQSLRDIADRCWAAGNHADYRALLAFIKERDAMLLHIKELERGH
jgi:hypothetical protein